jgi:DNA polymerase-4
MDWLFLDLNSYFASVEQQVEPKLRGKPIAVVPVETDRTCAIAASYEAKAFGVTTGTMIYEAKQKCPNLICVPARHDIYAEYHHLIRDEIEHHIPITHVVSIDEVSCQLIGSMRELGNAVALAKRIKAGIKKNIGPAIRCSIGIATNRFLAKLGSDLQKPDGLVVLHPRDLPDRIADLKLTDLCGISGAMQARLFAEGIWDTPTLWSAPPERLRRVWGGVEGERFWFRLHGVEVPDVPTRKMMVGHSHVLEPENRSVPMAGLVIRRLALKAAARLREGGLYASVMQVNARMERGPFHTVESRFDPVCDSQALMQQLTVLWAQIETLARTGVVQQVSMALLGLFTAEQMRQLELFPKPKATEAVSVAKREKISRVVDQLNRKLGRDTVAIGMVNLKLQPHTGAKIAFNRVPERWEFDERKTTSERLLAKLEAKGRRTPKAKKREGVPRALK